MKKHMKHAGFAPGLFYHPSLHHLSPALLATAIVLTAALFAGLAAVAGFLEQVVG